MRQVQAGWFHWRRTTFFPFGTTVALEYHSSPQAQPFQPAG